MLQHYAAVMKYISQGPMMLDVHMHKPLRSSRNFMDSLFAFWPGLQVGLWVRLAHVSVHVNQYYFALFLISII